MPAQRLSKAGAFSPGSDLWIFPHINTSAWTQKIDWYLNFQISKMQKHKAFDFSDELKAIIKDRNFSFNQIKADESAPLLVASQNRLPTKQTIVLNQHNKVKDWVINAYNQWLGLNCPTVRLFLPKDITDEEFQMYWPDLNQVQKVTLAPANSV